MSFDVYVQFFRGGADAGIEADAIRAAFDGAVEVVDEDYWKLHFGAETTDLFLGPLAGDAGRVHSVSFHRPVRDARLWDGVWQLLATTGAVVHWPGDDPAYARDAASLGEIPERLRESRGEPEVVGTASALLERFEAA
jgi:hypothetical protein